MAYVFKCTAKKLIGGKIPKGSTVQVVEQSVSRPQPKNILEALNRKFGTNLKSNSVSVSYFDVEKQ